MRAQKWKRETLLWGLCLSVAINTTAMSAPQEPGTAIQPASPAAPSSAQGGVQPKIDAQAPDATGLILPASTAITPPPVLQDNAEKPVRLTLLLPLRSDSLGNAANAVKAGFLAAFDQEKSGLALKIVLTTDIPEEVVSNYINALPDSDIVIGPLTRSSAAAIAESGAVRVPTISLTQSDAGSEGAQPLPAQMLTMGLSVEDEAREAAGWVAANKVHKVFVAYTSSAWQRRAAKAFAARARGLGMDISSIELGSTLGFLSALDLERIKKDVQAEKSATIFAALDAAQTKQLREVIGNEPAIYGTGQLNPVTLPDRTTAERMPELAGVRLLDIPWQLQPDHAAVMIYPRMVVAADQKRSADLERLYALGVDAFRVARQVAAQRKQFEVDGVTGRLKVAFDKNGTHFERIEPYAIYRDGLATFLSDGH